MEDKTRLVGFYTHNLTLTNMNFMDPNARLGDTQLTALASWMTHEEVRDEEVKRVMEKEEKEPLYIRVELVSPMVVTSNHRIIYNDVDLAPKIFSN